MLALALSAVSCSPGFDADGAWVTNRCGASVYVDLRDVSDDSQPVPMGFRLHLDDGERGEHTRTELTGRILVLEVDMFWGDDVGSLERTFDVSQFDVVVGDDGVRRYDIVLEGDEWCP